MMDSPTTGVVLVEGLSDQRALEAVASRTGRNLGAEGIEIVAMGGATNIRSFLERFGPPGLNLKLAGMCDVAEEGAFRRALGATGFGRVDSREEMERLGFFVCVEDLEDELIRALGADTVERVIESLGELDQLRTFRKQPAWRARAREQQLRRFFGTHSGRKIQSATALVDALDLARLPHPLAGLLARV
jgi:hypothetical protein